MNTRPRTSKQTYAATRQHDAQSIDFTAETLPTYLELVFNANANMTAIVAEKTKTGSTSNDQMFPVRGA
jgi:hypothetical protein